MNPTHTTLISMPVEKEGESGPKKKRACKRGEKKQASLGKNTWIEGKGTTRIELWKKASRVGLGRGGRRLPDLKKKMKRVGKKARTRRHHLSCASGEKVDGREDAWKRRRESRRKKKTIVYFIRKNTLRTSDHTLGKERTWCVG